MRQIGQSGLPQADESPAQFWNFAEGWSVDEGSSGGGNGSDACWASITEAAGKRTTAGLAALLPAVLSSRKYSPRLEVYASLAADAGAPKQVRSQQLKQSACHNACTPGTPEKETLDAVTYEAGSTRA